MDASEIPTFEATSFCESPDRDNHHPRAVETSYMMKFDTQGLGRSQQVKDILMTSSKYISLDWKYNIMMEMKKRRMKMRDLVKLTGTSPGNISRILSPDQNITMTNETAQTIGEELGFPLVPEPPNDLAVMWATELSALKKNDPEEFQRLIDYWEFLRSKKKKK